MPLDPFEVGHSGFRFWKRHHLGKKLLRRLFPKAMARRDARREAEGLATEAAYQFEDGGSMSKVTEALGRLRTSTKGGAAGLLAPLVVVLPFYEDINALLVKACQSEDGPIVMLTGAAITWVSFYVTARLSKTPANPGKL